MGIVSDVLAGRQSDRTPIWMMRQAGRYLPEYREVRAKAGSFLDLCYNPELAAEVTLQPIQRFGFDAAIIFSDILVIPDALGRRVMFVEGEGPLLEPLSLNEVDSLQDVDVVAHLEPVYEALRSVRDSLDPDISLFGFCGAPWTVATYMLCGRGGSDHGIIRRLAYDDPAGFDKLMEVLINASIDHLCAQIDAGADVVQIFDSWAGSLDSAMLQRYSVDVISRIVDGVKVRHVNADIIVFGRGAGSAVCDFGNIDGISGLSVDWGQSLRSCFELVDEEITLQGNLDPERLFSGGDALRQGVDDILQAAEGRRHIFNLGHGIGQHTPIAHVEALVRYVRGA